MIYLKVSIISLAVSLILYILFKIGACSLTDAEKFALHINRPIVNKKFAYLGITIIGHILALVTAVVTFIIFIIKL